MKDQETMSLVCLTKQEISERIARDVARSLQWRAIRKDELAARARDYVSLFVMSGHEQAATENLVWMLEQVEREVWGKVAEHCHAMHNDGYTLNDVLGCGNEGDVITGASNDELRTIERWARAQQQELG